MTRFYLNHERIWTDEAIQADYPARAQFVRPPRL